MVICDMSIFRLFCVLNTLFIAVYCYIFDFQNHLQMVGTIRNSTTQRNASTRHCPTIRKLMCFKQRQGQHVHCFQVCCARLTCSWCLKMLLRLKAAQQGLSTSLLSLFCGSEFDLLVVLFCICRMEHTQDPPGRGCELYLPLRRTFRSLPNAPWSHSFTFYISSHLQLRDGILMHSIG